MDKITKIGILFFLLCFPVWADITMEGDGGLDQITIANFADPNAGAQTWCAWVKFNALNDAESEHVLIHQDDGTGTGRTLLTTTDIGSVWEFSTFVGGSACRATTNLTTGVWYFPCVSWASGGSGDVNIWLNGVAENTCTKDPEACNGLHIIGQHKANTKELDGVIHSVSHWDVAQSAANLLAIYDADMKRFELQYNTSQDLLLVLDDIADGVSGDGVTFIDATGNGNNGTGDDGDASGLIGTAGVQAYQ